ncbi:putative membrane protein [Weissella uvarum]|uniref:phage holin family protein n=1 Tax=Weissella uvarum TaxID=1479233 RepID=UPI0019618F28|nr:phage holin family protein [Weissella uvarum]MBM7617992.1 putative membrane protein [Weissella uvarum]MCM0596211.1 phage holin family protein [Weissella uvarum]
MKVYTMHEFGFFQRLLINTVTFLALAGLLPQGMYVSSVWTALLAALILGCLNALVRPVLQLLALPLTILTFGLFGFVVNAAVLWLTSSIIGSGFHFYGFGWTLLVSIIMSLVNVIISNYFNRPN